MRCQIAKWFHRQIGVTTLQQPVVYYSPATTTTTMTTTMTTWPIFYMTVLEPGHRTFFRLRFGSCGVRLEHRMEINWFAFSFCQLGWRSFLARNDSDDGRRSISSSTCCPCYLFISLMSCVACSTDRFKQQTTTNLKTMGSKLWSSYGVLFDYYYY